MLSQEYLNVIALSLEEMASLIVVSIQIGNWLRVTFSLFIPMIVIQTHHGKRLTCTVTVKAIVTKVTKESDGHNSQIPATDEKGNEDDMTDVC